jgi:voltage-gated potassium channel
VKLGREAEHQRLSLRRHAHTFDGHRRPRPVAPAGAPDEDAVRPDIFERRLTRFLQKPATIRAAGGVIVSITTITVIVSGVLIRVFDPSEFASIGDGLWWALQTVTTVGYGDIVPKHVSGRIIAALVMLEGIAFITVVTAVITSIFIERARRESDTLAGQLSDHLQDTLASVDERLRRIEQRLGER